MTVNTYVSTFIWVIHVYGLLKLGKKIYNAFSFSYESYMLGLRDMVHIREHWFDYFKVSDVSESLVSMGEFAGVYL